MVSSSDALRDWIKDLNTLRGADWKTAFVETEEKFLDLAHSILWEEANAALSSLPEYNINEFREPLKTAVLVRGSIVLEMKTAGNLFVSIDLNKTAGNIEDYAAAVRIVRARKSKGTLSKGAASWFWKNFIYGQAREGKTFLRRNSTGAEISKQAKGIQMYAETISERLQAMGTLAPFWSLIDQGNATVSSMNEGGSPYPSNNPTHFVTKAEVRIRSMFSEAYNVRVRGITHELENINYGGKEVLEDILSPTEPRPYTLPKIIQRLKEGVTKFISRLFRRNT